MLVIGLTGGIGSGKSTVAELFQRQGIDLVDADVIAREVVAPGEPALARIAAHFGQQIIDEQGNLRRAALRERVFTEPAERQWLEQLLHPLIHARIREQLSNCRSPYCLLVSPLLLETSQKALVDRVLVVDVSRETQLNRTMARDGSSRETVEAILAAQSSRDARRAAADEIIDNEMTLAALSDRVAALHQAYLVLSADPRSRSEHRS